MKGQHWSPKSEASFAIIWILLLLALVALSRLSL